jgi:APA family basic amino acid/polyamine antiporter
MDAESSSYNGLGRSLGLFTATAIVIANMIGSGIFTTSGEMADILPGSGWVIFCWLLGGLIAVSGALCYAELATRMPYAGGEYIYLKRLYHPALGFLTGWTSFFVGFSAPIALSALGFTEYLFTCLANHWQLVDGFELTLAKKSCAIIIILTFTALHYLGTRLGAQVQNTLTLLKIALIVILASAGVLLGSGRLGGLSFNLNGPVQGMAFGAAMMMVMFSYSGWNASAYIASELKRPRITLPVSLVAGTAVVIVIYLAINLFIFHSAPYAELKGKIAVVEVASVWAFGNWLSDLLGGIIGVAMLSSLGAYIMLGPRIYYAMARDRLFFPFAGKVHPRYGVPGRAIIVQGLIAVAMVAAGTFQQLLIYVGFALGIFPLLAVAGLFIARSERIGEEMAVKVWAYPLVPLFFILSNIALMAFAYFERPLESTAAVISVLLGVPCYFLWIKRFAARHMQS